MAAALVDDVRSARMGRLRVVALADDGVSHVPQSGDARVQSAFVLSRIGNNREFRLYVASAASRNDGPSAGCPDATTSLVACSERETGDGVEVIETWVSVALPEAGPGKYTAIAPVDVGAAPAEDLRVERVVRLFLPGGGMVSARETVFGVESGNVVAAAFVESGSLVELVHDPTLLTSLTAS
ncbi:hypothetical protein [Nocardioides stalactiti]|uniref:hypothetical protein n=1 Tax=Nocardioides stalactiti TaxID=2755356 RepID=UPI0015FF8F9B|nr:hypothetical protein [Nocardioides stalactiti]